MIGNQFHEPFGQLPPLGTPDLVEVRRSNHTNAVVFGQSHSALIPGDTWLSSAGTTSFREYLRRREPLEL